MSYNEQRRYGIRLAQSENAVKTKESIRDEHSCYEDILTTAADEVGVDTLVSHVLESDPEWAYNTLIHVPDLGRHRDALIAKASESPEWALRTHRFVDDLGSNADMVAKKAGALLQSQGVISGFNLLDQAWYNCQFTMFWVNNGKPQPQTAVKKSNWGEWKWSSELHGGGAGVTVACSEFALPKAPLADGNSVWMYMWVRAGKDVESPLRFTYSPNTTDIAYFTATGSTGSPRVSLTKVASPALASA